MLTAEQQAALAAHDRSVSLSAGAGCGKTFVLVERFLASVAPGQKHTAELNELVAITFTDAAAREMRDRIRKRCGERLREADSREEQHGWLRVLRGLDRARISTIHSFCTELLRAHGVEVGIDPGFDVLDQPTAKLLQLETLDDYLRRHLSRGDERLIALAARFGLRTLREYVTLLLPGVDDVAERWLEADPADVLAAWDRFYGEYLEELAREVCEDPNVQRLQEIVSAPAPGSAALDEQFRELERLIGSMEKGGNLAEALAELDCLARVNKGPATKKAWDDDEAYATFRDACDKVRKLAKARAPYVQRNLAAEEEAAAAGLELLRLTAEVAEDYTAAKRTRNQLEFEDLLRHAHTLLTAPENKTICDRLSRSIRLLMVDEFQDTDPVQVELVKKLCGPAWNESGLFVVGDFKQSIYRFRGAEPEVSTRLRGELPEESRLSLTTNFRSQPAVLDFVNRLFEQEFQEYEPLVPSRPQLAEGPCIEFMWTPDEGAAEPSREVEARWLARRLAQLIDDGEPRVIDRHSRELRPVRPGDVAILMRSLNDVAKYETALREAGLDYYLAGGHAFYAQQEVFDVLNLLRAVGSIVDEVALAGALRSPLFSLSDEALFWLVQGHGSLGSAVLAGDVPKQLPEEEQEKVRRAVATIAELRGAKDRLTVVGLFDLALERTGYDAALLAEFLGDRKLANLDKLREQARALDRLSPGNLSGFITQLTELVEHPPKEALASTTTEGDVVQIMTIHRAKGLEFPVVAVPDLGRGSRPGDKQPVMDAEFGPLVPAREKDQKVALDWHLQQQRFHDLEERTRLLYVACTRAADYLLLSSSIQQKRGMSDWLTLIGSRFDLATGQPAEDAEMAGTVPEIHITAEEPPCPPGGGVGRGSSLAKTLAKARKPRAAEPVDPAGPLEPDFAERRRFSFSRLSGALGDEPTGGTEPAGAGGVDPRGLGLLVHAALERLDFAHPENHANLCHQLAPLHVPQNTEQAEAEAAEMLARFVESPLCQELAAASVIRREVELLLPWPGEPQSREYLHGFIDCLFQDAAGRWHLVDFKTNRVRPGELAKAARPYRLQMAVYAEACRRALAAEPASCTLHFLRAGEGYQFPPGELETQTITDQLNAARDAVRRPSS